MAVECVCKLLTVFSFLCVKWKVWLINRHTFRRVCMRICMHTYNTSIMIISRMPTVRG